MRNSNITKARRRIFAKAMQGGMDDMGVNQSDVARALWGTDKNKTASNGYMQQYGRDRISVYVRAESFPTPATYRKICEFLKIKPFSDHEIESGDFAENSITLGVNDDGDNIADVRINRQMPVEFATKIAAIIKQVDKFEEMFG
jgi:hypothetical protein